MLHLGTRKGFVYRMCRQRFHRIVGGWRIAMLILQRDRGPGRFVALDVASGRDEVWRWPDVTREG